MRSVHLGPNLAAGITLGLALLIAGVVGLGMAFQRGVVEPPKVDWQLGSAHIMAYRTSAPECPPYFCIEQSVEPAQAYYVLWHITELISDDQPYRRYRSMARRLFVVPLKS
jgi:hypothetical protein